MSFTSVLIREPKSRDDLTRALLALTSNVAEGVRYIASGDELSEAPQLVQVITMSLRGEAQYALEIYWSGLCDLADEAVAIYLAIAIQDQVIFSDDTPDPFRWLMATSSGLVQVIDLDVERLDDEGFVAYTIEP